MGKGIEENEMLPQVDCGAASVMHGDLNAGQARFGIVVSRFNAELTGQLLQSALACLRKYGADEKNITVVWVPGAYEIPQMVESMGACQDFDALIALGCVVQGETPHADLINTAVAQALMEIARKHSVPVVNEVVGTYTWEQAVARCRYGEGSRGWYAAAAAVEMASVSAKFDGQISPAREVSS